MSKTMTLLGVMAVVAMAGCSKDSQPPTKSSKSRQTGPSMTPDEAAPPDRTAPPDRAAAQGRRWRHRPRGLMRKLDADGDGKLSKAELEGAAKSLLAFDANGDGELTFDEVHKHRKWRGKRGRRGWRSGMRGMRRGKKRGLMGKLDADGDGKLSKAEIAGAAKALLALDTNGDGELSFDEIRPHRRWRGRRGWRHGMGRGRGWRHGMGRGRGWRHGQGGGRGWRGQGGGMGGGQGGGQGGGMGGGQGGAQ